MPRFHANISSGDNNEISSLVCYARLDNGYNMFDAVFKFGRPGKEDKEL